MVADKGSMKTELLNEWRKKVYSQRPGHIFLNSHSKRLVRPVYKTFLAFDSATSHRNSDFKNIMAKNYDTKVEIIPRGMTPLLQPADVSWNKSVKTSVKRQWREWMDRTLGPEDYTKFGNLRKPSYSTVAEWCLNAWKELSTEQIIKSFKQCCLGPQRNDSELHSK
jgi:hypothetical protein